MTMRRRSITTYVCSLVGAVVLSSSALATPTNCGISASLATSIAVDEFYFGSSVNVIPLPQGLTVSLWAIDPENPVANTAGMTQYLISVGYGDIAEQPRVYRISTPTPRRLTTPRVTFTGGDLVIKFADAMSGAPCHELVLDLDAKSFQSQPTS